MPVRVAINGFGRIGRLVLRSIIEFARRGRQPRGRHDDGRDGRRDVYRHSLASPGPSPFCQAPGSRPTSERAEPVTGVEA